MINHEIGVHFVDNEEVVGSNPADVALAWALFNPVVTAPIIGPRTVEHLNGNLRTFEILLSDESSSSSMRSDPVRATKSPEAYAW